MFTKVGLDALLTPENCLLMLIDHQPFQLVNVNSHEPTMVINNVTALAKTAKAYGIPTILTSVNGERGGKIFSQVQAVFPDLHQCLGRPARRRSSEEDWQEKTCHRSPVVGDVSCNARDSGDGRRIRRVRRH
jgi:nicotinamidase-related amidase